MSGTVGLELNLFPHYVNLDRLVRSEMPVIKRSTLYGITISTRLEHLASKILTTVNIPSRKSLPQGFHCYKSILI